MTGMNTWFDVEMVDLLQGQITRLWVAEVDEGNESEVGAHEDEIRFPLESVDDDGSDHDDDEVLKKIC